MGTWNSRGLVDFWTQVGNTGADEEHGTTASTYPARDVVPVVSRHHRGHHHGRVLAVGRAHVLGSARAVDQPRRVAVERVRVRDVEQLGERFFDEDERNEGGEGLLRETRDVTHQRGQVEGDDEDQ